MAVTFDPAKDAANIRKHGLSLADFAGFDAASITEVDDRYDYGEVRYRSLGSIDGVLHVVVFTLATDTLRIISFRRARQGGQTV